MPEVPQWLTDTWDTFVPNKQRWNVVTDFFIDPCEAPIWVYWETAKPALFEFGMAWFTVSPQQLAQNYLKPNTPRGCLRPRKGRGGSRFHPLFKGIDEAIADELPGRGLFQNRRAAAETISIFELNELIERPLYWLMLADLTEDFFYNWASGLMSTGYCQESATPTFRQWDCNPGFNPTDDWQTLAANTPTYSRGGADGHLMQWEMPGGQHTAIWSGTIVNTTPLISKVQFRLHERTLTKDHFIAGPTIDVPPNGTASFTAKWNRPTGGVYNIHGNSGPMDGFVREGRIWDMGR